MNLIESVLKDTADWRKRFGHFRGIWLWNSWRASYKLSKGSMFELHVPGYQGPVALRAGCPDADVFRQQFVYRELSFPVHANPSFVIDAGAHIGCASIYLAERFPDARVVALEVDRENFSLLLRNTRPYRNITVLRKALWGKSGHVRIINPEDASWAFRVVEALPQEDGAIEAISVTDLLEQFGEQEIGFIKLDIEGAEQEVLASAETWIGRARTLAIELHDRFRPGCSESLQRAVGNMKHTRRKYGEYDVIYFT